MAFEQKLEDDIVELLEAGASFTLGSEHRLQVSLVRLATAARTGGGQLRLTGLMSKLQNDLVAIARAGRGHVTFE
jgi:hypothetical protein